MSNQPQLSFEILNAYVDGELDSDSAAMVMSCIAQDKAVARQVVALTKLRATTAKIVEYPEISLPGHQSPNRTRFAAAACFAVMLWVGGSIFLYQYSLQDDPAWLSEAWNIHAAASKGVHNPSMQSIGYQDSLPLKDMYIPNLSSGKLKLIGVTTQLSESDVPMRVARYRGTRGCQVTLISFAKGNNKVSGYTQFQTKKGKIYAWRAGQLIYVLVSSSMDPMRLSLLANSIHRLSLDQLPIDQQTQLALQESRERSLPCASV